MTEPHVQILSANARLVVEVAANGLIIRHGKPLSFCTQTELITLVRELVDLYCAVEEPSRLLIDPRATHGNAPPAP